MLPSQQLCLGAYLALFVMLGSCATSSKRGAFITAGDQPRNLGDAKIAALAYHDSGDYARDLAVVAGQATSWISGRAANAVRPALVLDIDETSLSNWEIIKLDDFWQTDLRPLYSRIRRPLWLGGLGPIGPRSSN